MMNQASHFSSLRPDLFATSRSSDSETASKSLMALAALVADQFALQLGEWSGQVHALTAMLSEGELGVILPAVATNGLVASAESSDGAERLFVAMDGSAVKKIIELFFGGDAPGTPAFQSPPAGRITRSLASTILEALTGAICKSLSASLQDEYHFVGLADDVESLELGGQARPVRLALGDGEDACALYFAVARAAAARFDRTQFSAQQAARAMPDTIWQNRMHDRVKAADITIEAVLDGPTLSLARIIRLQPGDLIGLNAGLDALVRVEHRGAPICLARLGQTDGALSLCVERGFSEEYAGKTD
jgi:hypothetical protein